MFYMMLAKFEEMSLMDCLKNIANAVDNKDYEKMKSAAHSLKGASGYIGASRLHYSCYFIQDHFMNKRYSEMLEYYPTLLESAVEFKVYSR